MSRNVALVVMDTTRARDTVPADPEHTPTLATLADAGTEYTRAYAHAPWTLPSHASLFTGTYPSEHGAHGDHTRLDDGWPTLAEAFRSAGYETAGFSNNTWIAEEFGLARGFDTFQENHDHEMTTVGEESPDPSLIDLLRDEGVRELGRRIREWLLGADDKGADRTVQWIREWLDARRGEEPFFLFANFIEPHIVYSPPREYAEPFLPDGWSYEEAAALPQNPREYDAGLFDHDDEEWAALRALYRGEIAYLDAQIGRIVDSLKAAGEWEDTVLLVTSDHGENVGEHGMLGHQYNLYETVVHVPLVAHGGAFAGGAEGSDDLVELVDVVPTLLDAAGIDAAQIRRTGRGRSFHPSAERSPRTEVLAEHLAPQPPIEHLEEQFGDLPDRVYRFQRSLRALRTERYKYVRGSDGTEELYDLAADPGETDDVADEAPDVTAQLRRRLDERTSVLDRAEGGEVSMDPETKRQLSDLGYL